MMLMKCHLDRSYNQYNRTPQQYKDDFLFIILGHLSGILLDFLKNHNFILHNNPLHFRESSLLRCKQTQYYRYS